MIEKLANLPMWRPDKSRLRVEIFLSQEAMSSSELMAAQLSGFDVRTTMLDPGLPVPAESLKSAEAVVVEVRCDQNSSMERLQRLVAGAHAPAVIAAVHEPSLGEMRVLMRTGIADVIPLPLKRAELEAALGRISTELEGKRASSRPKGKVVSVAKSRGGVGATTVLTQLACTAAASGKEDGGACLVDFDLQFGNAALYLGELPALGIKDLLEAGSRADGALLRTMTAEHSSGLRFMAAPPEIVPLDSVTADQVSDVLDLVRQEFGTVFVDLPTNWTDWSLSILARSDLVLFVSELNVSNLHQARKQLDLIRQQELGNVPIQLVMNKVEKKLFRTIDFADAEKILGLDVSWSIADDPESVGAALDQGLRIEEVSPRSRINRDLNKLAASLVETLKVAG